MLIAMEVNYLVKSVCAATMLIAMEVKKNFPEKCITSHDID